MSITRQVTHTFDCDRCDNEGEATGPNDDFVLPSGWREVRAVDEAGVVTVQHHCADCVGEVALKAATPEERIKR